MNVHRQPKSRFKQCWWWVGLLPVGFVLGLVGYVYFILMSQVIVPLLQSSPLLGVVEFLVGHLMAGLLLTSFLRTIASDPGFVPIEYYIEHDHGPETIPNGPQPKMCSKCQKPKPPRTHHCRVCGRCILKMDHHCPWVNNCVGFRNYKFFVLFVTYIPVACLTVLFLCIPFVVSTDYSKTFDMWTIQVFAVMAICALFGLSMSGFAGVHYHLVWMNETTIENFDRERAEAKANLDRRRGREVRSDPHHNFYDLRSGRKNFEQVFGANPWVWFLPVRSSPGDGVEFPVTPLDFERGAIFGSAEEADELAEAAGELPRDGARRGSSRGRTGRESRELREDSDFEGGYTSASEDEDWQQRRR